MAILTEKIALRARFKGTFTVNPASVAAVSVATQTFTIAGLTTDMMVMVSMPALVAGLSIGGAWVSAANTLSVKFVNPTAGALDDSARALSIVAF